MFKKILKKLMSIGGSSSKRGRRSYRDSSSKRSHRRYSSSDNHRNSSHGSHRYKGKGYGHSS